MEDHFGGVGETYAIQGTVDEVIYNLWGMKEPNYVMKMMATGGHLLADDTRKETVIIWKKNGERNSSTSCHLIDIIVTAMHLTTTTISGVQFH